MQAELMLAARAGWSISIRQPKNPMPRSRLNRSVRAAFYLLLFGCGRVGFSDMTGAAVDDGNLSSGDVVVDQRGADSPLCASLGELRYDFDGTGSALWMPYTDPGMTLSESGNRLVIPLPNGMAGTAGYFSTCRYDLTGQRVFVTAAVVPRVGTMTDMYLAVGSMNNVFGVNVTRGSIEAYRLIGPNYTQLASLPYNAAQHKVLQVREAGGEAFWEVSADGASFTTLYRAAPPFDVSAIQLLLFADAIVPVANPGTAEFAKLNLL